MKRQFLQERRVAAFDGQRDLIQRPDQGLQRPDETYARDGGEGFEKFPVQWIEEPDQLGRQVSATQTAIDVIDRVKGLRVTTLAFRRRAQPRSDPRGHEDFIANRLHSDQERMASNTVVENFTGDFGNQVRFPLSLVRCQLPG